MSKEVNWQQECLKKGFEYVREPDDHYVVASPAEMVALLRDLLGVDVRTKDCDSYGVAVCELQEQVDELVNSIHAQQAERDALLAERDRLRDALGWYAEQASGCRKLGAGGDEFRHALDHDGGARARAALQGEQQ